MLHLNYYQIEIKQFCSSQIIIFKSFFHFRQIFLSIPHYYSWIKFSQNSTFCKNLFMWKKGIQPHCTKQDTSTFAFLTTRPRQSTNKLQIWNSVLVWENHNLPLKKNARERTDHLRKYKFWVRIKWTNIWKVRDWPQICQWELLLILNRDIGSGRLKDGTQLPKGWVGIQTKLLLIFNYYSFQIQLILLLLPAFLGSRPQGTIARVRLIVENKCTLKVEWQWHWEMCTDTP